VGSGPERPHISGIDPSTDTVAQTVAVGGDPTDVAAAAGSLWIANHASDTVVRVDPRTGRTQSVVRTAGGPSGLAATGDAVWVTNDQSGSVQRIDALTDAITATIRVGVAPSAIAATTGAVWVLDPLDATVSRIDPTRAVVAATVPLAGAPAGLTVFDGSVWVADKRHGVLFRVDPRRAAVTSTSQIGEHPVALTAGGGIWVAVERAGASHRGGTLTSLSSTAIDTIDPAASNSQNIAVPQQFGLTNDGLVTLNHAAGPNGTRLVPDLAMALPVPTSNGRTYTFHLRPGIRYSTGALVEPRDVTHSFERLFELGSSGADWYEAITGAPGCARGQGMCDLSRGIVANDRADTVTFHLSRPDPDFLYKLTLTYADVLPASTPSREARTPLPATGPYMIARYAPGYELRLVRNPRFREWSAAAQPDGYPDQILIRLRLTGSQGAAEVADGKGDFMPIIYSIPGTSTFRLLQRRGEVRVNAGSGGTAFLFLNVTVPPFNDLWVRRALNLALDRGRIVKLDGGAIAADPTCQILPPQLPGYRRYCPYTRDPRPDGRWHGPDLPRARRLVAASGTYGMKVAVWDTAGPQFALNEGNATVAALKRLGYRASLRLLPDSTYFTYTNDSRNHPQIIDGGWSTDYPSANDYIGKLTCRYFVPGNGPATTDASEFCDPALDKQIARADTLQATDPSAAAALWAQLDRQLTDLAIWLPTVNGKEIDLIARRAGNYQYNPSWGPLLDQLWVR
jgi:YVTN family beta-propeller protein